jgi:antitoxin component of MazEF toxin-antitoxin module
VYRKFLNARSPLRLLEKGLHGGLGPGNLGIVIGGHGVGKASFLVGVALDELLRSGRVLHASMAHTVSHIRDHYDTVFEELAASAHLKDETQVHVDIDRNRSIRVYPKNALTTAKLREAVKVESEISGQPSLVVIEGLDFETTSREDFVDLKALAGEIAAEVWLSISSNNEQVAQLPPSVERVEDLVSVALALEPGDDVVLLRALKDHDNPDLTDLHVALDPKTLLLTRH